MNAYTTSPDVRSTFASPQSSCTPQAENWHESPAAIGIIAAITDMSAVTSRLETIRAHNPELRAVGEAEELVGSTSIALGFKTFARGMERRVQPSNGTCAVSALWDLLSELRTNAIEAQIEGERLPLYTDAGLSEETAEAAYKRYQEIDRDASSVELAFLYHNSAGRA